MAAGGKTISGCGRNCMAGAGKLNLGGEKTALPVVEKKAL